MKNGKPRAGFSLALDKSALGDPRSGASIRQGADPSDFAPPFKGDAQGRIGLNVSGPLKKTPQGTLDLNVGDGLAVKTGSPERLVVAGSDSVVVNANGVHARPRASQVRDDTGAGGGTLADTLRNRVELRERRGAVGGYAPLDSRGRIASTYGGVSLGVAQLDSNVQVPPAQLGTGFGGAGALVLTDTTPPSWAIAPLPLQLTMTSRVLSSDDRQVLTDQLIYVDCSGGVVNVTLLPAADWSGVLICVKPISVAGGDCMVFGSGAELIDTNNLLDLSTIGAVWLVSDGSQVWIL